MKFLIRFLIFLIVLGIIFLWMMMRMSQQNVTERTGVRADVRRTSITLDSFLHVQQLRKKQLRQFCERFPQLRSVNGSTSAEHLLSGMTVSHKLMTLYCKPQDVTIDGWEDLVQDVERRSDVTLSNPLPVADNASTFPDQLVRYTPTMLAQVLRTYTKVLFIGDPFERLVSLYMQDHSGNVPFEEFIEDILLMETREDGVSSTSVVHLCSPCFVQYDYIVLIDFLPVEVTHILRRIGVPGAVEPSIDQSTKVTSRWLSNRLFRALDKEQLRQLTQLYSWDFTAFPLHNSLMRKWTQM